MKDHDAISLLKKYKSGECTPAELALLESWYLQWNTGEKQFSESELHQVQSEMWAVMPEKPVKKLLKTSWWKRSAVAACITIAIAAGVYVWTKPVNTSTNALNSSTKDVSPGGNRAILSLSNGEKLVLSTAKTGLVIDATKLSYNDGTALLVNTAKQLTLETPRGGIYQIVLPDGSRVWLNAASSITFPANFKGLKNRKVELTGEAYFEVAKNASQPFIVHSAQQEVQVLGTHFNVSAYPDEATSSTTLLEGIVQVARPGLSGLKLKPGQQAVVLSGQPTKLLQVDADESVAWKDGLFDFNDTELKTIMRQISRWYNVDVIYEDEPGDLHFGASISRNEKLSKVLEMLEGTGLLSFKISGNRVYVKKTN